MDIETRYNVKVDERKVSAFINNIAARAKELKDKNLFRKIFSLIDLTSLDVADTDKKILGMVQKVNKFSERFNEIPNVAAICIYPTFVPLLNDNLKDKSVKKATVAASFPSSQAYSDVKLLEVKRVVEEGADEVDIVMPVGKFLEGRYEEIYDEIVAIKNILGERHLKVILETGTLKDLEKIKFASFLCMEAGADFIKTSTGKTVREHPPKPYM